MRSALVRLRHPIRRIQQSIPLGTALVEVRNSAQETAQPVVMRCGSTERAFVDGSVMIW